MTATAHAPAATVHARTDGPVRILTIDNSAKRNAFTGLMTTRLLTLLQEADADSSVRCIVVTGAGTGSFSSGHDLAEVLENPETAGDPTANAAFTIPPLLGTPVIGAINGNAYAAGFILALNCDLRVAGSNARFCAVGARIGLVPVGGQLSRLLDVVSYPIAFKMLATATPIDAHEALSAQFVTAVCPPEDTVDEAVRLGKQIAEVSPAVIRAIKTGLRATMSHGRDPGLALEPLLAEVVRGLPDGAEGVDAFLGKRPARYPDSPDGLQDRLDEVVAARVASWTVDP
ncbi:MULTISPECIES: enoyl-CoA hydratase/isomerase family protein [unclassified Aeromicrobium]|uniref:enoyl-CoA hydratase/isomerase family protein n=1 Tax=unclassified Aeromicrobium TaxID=2633570 RepID=UPI0028890347|nr:MULTISPECIES: enoyl-CoA hydratase/isomerase family protein [unclassified Aeromicrobium]